MAVYYPQGVVTLRVLLEDNGIKTKARLQDVKTFTCVAKQINVNLNSYREADTFTCTLDFKNFPFDPRAIRSAGIVIFIQDRKELFRTNNSLNLLKAREKAIVFQGFVDSDRISLDDESRTVTLEGRDFTSLLLDRQYFGKEVQLTKPLDKVIQDLLNELDETKFNGKDNAGISVVNQTGEELPVLANLSQDKSTKKGSTKNGRPKRSYWDVIQDITNKAGLISYISLDKLIITRPRNLYKRDNPQLFVYGGNLSNLEFERKLGRQKSVNIRVVSLNYKKKEVIEALIPEEGTEEWAKDLGITLERITVPQVDAEGKKIEPEKPAPFITFKVRDVISKEQLVKIGENLFEEIGRQQIEGSLTTKEMQVCDVKKNTLDATLLRVGTPIAIDINQGDLRGMPKFSEKTKPEAKKAAIKKFLKEQCYDDVVADAFAESLANFDTPFYTQEIEFSLDQESGWQMTINFVNFITVPESLAGKK